MGITNSASGTRVDEIAEGIFRIHTPIPPSAMPGGFSFNQYLLLDDEPLLFHTGLRKLFPLVREAVASVIVPERLRYLAFSHYEADECGALNEWLAAAPKASPLCGRIAAMVSVDDVADRPARALGDGEEVRLGRLAEHTAGVERVAELAQPFTPEVAAPRCGVDADVIRRLARELAGSARAAVYARIGTTTQEFGTLASWLVDVVNVLTAHLDEPGGAMFTRAAAGAATTRGTPGRGKGVRFGRRHSRVRGLPEVYGELPVACLAEEIETPGDGQVRALITIAGNPVLSTPNGTRLARALASLDFMVSLDIYVNETTRHADRRARFRRDPRGPGSAARPRAHPRPPATHGPVRRWFRP